MASSDSPLHHHHPWAPSPFVRSLLAGAVAGTTVDVSLYPLDTLKTRLQSAQGFYRSGGFHGIYAGLSSCLIGSAPGAALFFVTYDALKRHLTRLADRHSTLLPSRASGSSNAALRTTTGTPVPARPLSASPYTAPVIHMVAATAGEVAACAVRVPTEVLKQRTQAGQSATPLAALRDILSHRHARGLAGVWLELYRGWGITVMREIPFTVIQFPLWEALKSWRARSKIRGIKQPPPGEAPGVTAVESAVFGSISGAVAAGFTTPLDVLKTRMMLSKERIGLFPLLVKILKENGSRAFFAGIGPRVGWISAGGAVFLGSYQWAINLLGGEI